MTDKRDRVQAVKIHDHSTENCGLELRKYQYDVPNGEPSRGIGEAKSMTCLAFQ